MGPEASRPARAGAAFLLLAAAGCAPRPEGLRVLAAVSLTEAVTEAAAAYQKERGGKVSASFASSAVLGRQILSGVEADVFISADEDWMDRLQARGLIVPESRRTLCGNRLVLIRRKGTPPLADWGAMAGPGLRRLALADWDSVPSGVYARQAFVRMKLWDAVERKAVAAMDVRAALAYVERGEADFGVVYATDAGLSSAVVVDRRFPEDSHAPIRYPAAVLASSRRKDPAGEFVRFLASSEGVGIWKKHGFIPL